MNFRAIILSVELCIMFPICFNCAVALEVSLAKEPVTQLIMSTIFMHAAFIPLMGNCV